MAEEPRTSRRRLLAALGASSALAGCFGRLSSTPPTDEDEDDADSTVTPAPVPSRSPTSESSQEVTPVDIARHGIPPTICEEAIRPSPGIYAIMAPAFGSDWSDQEIGLAYRYDRDVPELVEEQTIVGLTDGDRARAYPLSVLTVHEIVNDSFGGPVIVTYCPLCRSGMVADRRVGDEVTQFGVSGLLWQAERIREAASEEAGRVFGATRAGGEQVSVRNNGNLVMYDAATRSYWSQMLARSICGPEKGARLSIRPSSLATWGEWRAEHPDTDVLLPPPYSEPMEPGTILGEDPVSSASSDSTPTDE